MRSTIEAMNLPKKKKKKEKEKIIKTWNNWYCYIPRLSLNKTGTAIGWFLVTWPWLKSNLFRSWYIWAVPRFTPLGIYYSTWSKHDGNWRDRRREKHCHFSFSWMKTTTQTWSLKLLSNDFQSYPRRETAASWGKRCR